MSQIRFKIPEPFEFLTKEKSRYKVLYGGRGGAKSHNIARSLLFLGILNPLRIVCAREIQKSIKDSVHALLADIIRKHDLENFYIIQHDTIKGKNGTEFKFKGLKHNISEIKSLEGTDILWIEEAENVSDQSYEILIPTIRKPNSEIWISFNVKNVSDPTYVRFVASDEPDIIRKKVSWRDNPFFPEVLDKERKKLERSDPVAYAHIWEGEPDVRRNGCVYANAIAKARDEKRICLCPYDPEYEVFTAWDLGFGDATAIWWLQFVGRELRWLEYYENNQQPLEHYVKIIKEKNYNYMKDGHFLPHDAASTQLTGSVAQKIANLGVSCRVLKRSTDLRADRELLNQVLEYSVFNEPKTKDGLFALESYHFQWDEDKGRFKKEPVHDWSSHGADAARYAATAAQNIKAIVTQKPEQTTSYFNNTQRSSWMG